MAKRKLSTKKKATTKKQEEDIDVSPMEFSIDLSVLGPKRTDSVEKIRLKKGLDEWIPKLGVRRGNIPIPARLKTAAKKYLDEAFPENKFSYAHPRDLKTGKLAEFWRVFKTK